MKKKKVEFKKKLAIFAVLIIILSSGTSYVLAFLGLQTVENLAAIIITTCFAYLVAYATTSTFEKNSRNKYQVDENGVPFNLAPEATLETNTEENGG